MAMTKCPECGDDVSSTALKCPKCGFQINKPKRSFFGKIFLWMFILFNILMVVWIVGGVNAASEMSKTYVSEAQKAGAAIGTGLGVTMLLGIWVFGDIILGLFTLLTRPKG